MTKSNLERKAFMCLAYVSTACSSLREVGTELNRAGTVRQRLWRSVAYWLAPLVLFSLLSYRTQNYQAGNSTTYHGLHSSINRHLLLACWEVILQRHFLNWELFLSDASSLCQVEITLTTTVPLPLSGFLFYNVGGSLCSRSTWSTEWVPGQP